MTKKEILNLQLEHFLVRMANHKFSQMFCAEDVIEGTGFWLSPVTARRWLAKRCDERFVRFVMHRGNTKFYKLSVYVTWALKEDPTVIIKLLTGAKTMKEILNVNQGDMI